MVTNFNVTNWANREIKILAAKTRYTVLKVVCNGKSPMHIIKSC